MLQDVLISIKWVSYGSVEGKLETGALERTWLYIRDGIASWPATAVGFITDVTRIDYGAVRTGADNVCCLRAPK